MTREKTYTDFAGPGRGRGQQGHDMKKTRLKDIMEVCLTLHKRADYFLNNEPEHLSVEDFDAIALELEEVARKVDGFCEALIQETGETED